MSINIVGKLKTPRFDNAFVHGKHTAVRASQNRQLLNFQCRVMDLRAQATLFSDLLTYAT